MVLIEWKDEFSVGIPDVDHEHQEIIQLINNLHDAMSGENATISVMDFLGEIYAHVSAHFALEEKIMRTHSDLRMSVSRLLEDKQAKFPRSIELLRVIWRSRLHQRDFNGLMELLSRTW